MKYLSVILPLLFLGCTQNPKWEDTKPVEQNTNRFELVQLGSMRRDQFLLDKQTGQIWRPTCMAGAKGADCDYAAWMKQDVQDVNASGDSIHQWGREAEEMNRKRK